eukprot:TRINITY_DN357_c0_g1_i1.p1 TRINITY_DN357_c0_g1~~TRINITY_DN357_c0_g1_i1.p1  ORF type:complete len:197 (-),score=78.42 TRINITY_DN357_c0_g1_i1:27-617(-)
MLIPKKNRVAIYSYLFKEGVLVAKDDVFAPKHMELDVPNLHVLYCLKSLKSREFVTQQFNWGYYYWYLTNEGIEYLRGFLHLPEEIVPATLKKPRAPAAGAPGGRPGYRGDRGDRGDRPEGGRRFGGDRQQGEKKVGPGGDFQPSFSGEGGAPRGGFGRGRPAGGRGAGGYRREGGEGRPASGGAGEGRSFGRGRA